MANAAAAPIHEKNSATATTPAPAQILAAFRRDLNPATHAEDILVQIMARSFFSGPPHHTRRNRSDRRPNERNRRSPQHPGLRQKARHRLRLRHPPPKPRLRSRLRQPQRPTQNHPHSGNTRPRLLPGANQPPETPGKPRQRQGRVNVFRRAPGRQSTQRRRIHRTPSPRKASAKYPKTPGSMASEPKPKS